MKKVPLILMVVVLGMSQVPSATAATPVKVLGGSKNQVWVAKAPGYLAYTESPASLKRTGRTTLFLQPDGSARIRVNPTGTFASHPSIDLGNVLLGNVMAYAQRNQVDGPGDIRLFDLDSSMSSAPPAGVNTVKNEDAPVISGNLLMFRRAPKAGTPKQLILFDLSTDTPTVLDEAYYIFPGSIEGDWLSWEACQSRCQVFRYRISTQEVSRVRKPKANSIVYSPLIDAAGRVYYLDSGVDCGEKVKLYRATPGGKTLLYSFPPGVDAWLGDYDAAGTTPQIYFARQACSTVNGDIYRIAVG
jgi:hypothetical protein